MTLNRASIRLNLFSSYSRSPTRRIDIMRREKRSSAGERGVNPDLGIVRDLGCAALHEAHVFTVDEYVDVAADIVLIVEDALADTGVIVTEHHERLANRGAHVGWQPQLDDSVIAGPSAQRGWQMKAHRIAQATTAAFRHSTAGNQSAIERQLSPSSADANNWPPRVPK